MSTGVCQCQACGQIYDDEDLSCKCDPVKEEAQVREGDSTRSGKARNIYRRDTIV